MRRSGRAPARRPDRTMRSLAVTPAFREFVLDQLKSGMPPADVADLVHDAVVNDRFWIFTDMEMVKAMEPRYQAILAAENPPTVGLGPS